MILGLHNSSKFTFSCSTLTFFQSSKEAFHSAILDSTNIVDCWHSAIALMLCESSSTDHISTWVNSPENAWFSSKKLPNASCSWPNMIIPFRKMGRKSFSFRLYFSVEEKRQRQNTISFYVNIRLSGKLNMICHVFCYAMQSTSHSFKGTNLNLQEFHPSTNPFW